jgi:VWFA-related protein
MRAAVSFMSPHLLRLLVVICALLPATVSISGQDQGIRIDLAPDGHVRIENPFGGVHAEVWDEKFVLVSARTAGKLSFRRSPVVIENRNRLLLVSIIRTPLDPQVDVFLTVRLPRTIHVEVNTESGAIVVSGLPATMSLKTSSGDIRAELSETSDLDITARSADKAIRSDLDAPLADGGRSLNARSGSGSHVLRINTESGLVSLLERNEVAQSSADTPNPPALIGTDSGRTAAAGIPATDIPNEEVSEGDVIRVDSQLVTLNVSVIDRQTNRGVLGLTQDDFHVFEDGSEQRILKFDSAAAPFDLILLIDLSGSTREVVKLIRQAALRFVDAARPSDRIGVVTFAGQANLVSPVTLDRERLRDSVSRIDTAAGDTKLYDAVDFVLRHLRSDRRNTRRTAMVLMSDGLDGTVPGVSRQQGSRLLYPQLINAVREYDGVVYTLWLDTYYEALHPQDTTAEAFDTGHDRMKALAETGGGAFYEVERLEDLSGAYERVVADLGTVYSLAYRPQNKTRDGQWRSIRVELNRPSAVARGKHGYYAN